MRLIVFEDIVSKNPQTSRKKNFITHYSFSRLGSRCAKSPLLLRVYRTFTTRRLASSAQTKASEILMPKNQDSKMFMVDCGMVLSLSEMGNHDHKSKAAADVPEHTGVLPVNKYVSFRVEHFSTCFLQ